MNQSLHYIFPNPPAGLSPAALVCDALPRHIAVIMDGNGRWAKERSKIRLEGHKAGIKAVRELIRTASDLGIGYVTIYSFSSENWRRPQDEVSGLMDLFAKTMLAEVDELHKEGVRVKAIGRLDVLPPKTKAAFEIAWEKTRNNTGMTLLVAVNYGSRTEILDACASLCEKAVAAYDAGESFEINEEVFSSHLYTHGMPDPDLVIRTSGELRLSNFLLWQIAYAELYCTEVFWPDFDRYELLRALLAYQARNRRFGGVS